MRFLPVCNTSRLDFLDCNDLFVPVERASETESQYWTCGAGDVHLQRPGRFLDWVWHTTNRNQRETERWRDFHLFHLDMYKRKQQQDFRRKGNPEKMSRINIQCQQHTFPFESLGSVKLLMFLKIIFYAHHGFIYLFRNALTQ